MNFLGLDWGQRKIGLALADGETKIACPILTLSFNRPSEVIAKLREIIEKEKIEVIVVGEPVSLSGEKRVATEYQQFVAKIEKLGVPLKFEDERFSTRLANSLKKQFRGVKKVNDDEIAAAAILQGYLDKIKNEK